MIDLVTLREFLFRKKNLSLVRHITLNPGGPGVVRLHMLPPASHLRRSVPYVVILNGHDVLPLNISWAILLACLMDALAPYADREVPDADLDGVAERAVAAARRVYPGVKPDRMRAELERMLQSFIAIARGQQPPEEVQPISLEDYAPQMTAPHRMDLMVSAMEKEGRWNCNQKCLHCYAAGQPDGEAAELDTAGWKRVLAALRRAGVPQITFTGGEPTLRADLVELVDAARWFVTRLNTNGRLLTPRLCQALYEASLDSVQITLYSADESIHNELVGAPGFADTVAGIRSALAAGLSVSVNTPLCSATPATPKRSNSSTAWGCATSPARGSSPPGRPSPRAAAPPAFPRRSWRPCCGRRRPTAPRTAWRSTSPAPAGCPPRPCWAWGCPWPPPAGRV